MKNMRKVPRVRPLNVSNTHKGMYVGFPTYGTEYVPLKRWGWRGILEATSKLCGFAAPLHHIRQQFSLRACNVTVTLRG